MNKIKYYEKQKNVILCQCVNGVDQVLCVFVDSVVESHKNYFDIIKDKKTFITSLFKYNWSIELYD